MSLAKITLYGMTRWMQESEDDLFANMDLPTGWDKDILVDTIMLHGAEFEVLYANPDYMKNAIGVWSNKWYFTLERWIKALSIDYDPLENYDRREVWSDAGSRNKTGSGTDSGTRQNAESRQNSESRQNAESRNNSSTTESSTNSSTANSSYSKSEHDSTTKHEVSAFDSSDYQPESKDILSGDDTVTNESSATSASGSSSGSDRLSEDVSRAESSKGVESTTRAESDQRSRTDNESEQNSSAHTGRIHGNVGVTTSQQMLQAELDIAKFNMYEEAANLFLTELCIYTY